MVFVCGCSDSSNSAQTATAGQNSNQSVNTPLGTVEIVVSNISANAVSFKVDILNPQTQQSVIPSVTFARTGSAANQTLTISNVPVGTLLFVVTTLDANHLSLDTGQGTVTVTGGAPAQSTVSLSPLHPGAPVATKLAFVTQPTSGNELAVIAPAVQVDVQDANNTLVSSSNATVTLSLGSNPAHATLGGTVSVTAVNGVATFSNLTLSRAGSGLVLTASSTGLSSASSSPFNESPVATQLVFTIPPTNSLSNQPITPSVQVSVEDVNGVVVSGANNSISLAIGTNPSGGTLSGATTVAAVNGVATFSGLSIDLVGSGYTLTTFTSGLSSASSVAFDVLDAGGPGARLVYLVQPSAVLTGAPIAPAVQVVIQDAGGVTVANATDTITISLQGNPGGSTLSGTLSVAAVNGVATFSDLSLNLPGSNYSLVANSSFAGVPSVPFTVSTSAAPWPRFHQNSLATSLSTFSTTNDTGTLIWSYPPTNPVSSFNANPVVDADGTIYIGNDNSQFFAINVDGSLLWSFPADDLSITSGAAALATDGTIYWALLNDHLRALNPDGTLKWDFQATSFPGDSAGLGSSPVVGSDGTIYYFSSGGTFYALNPDGSLKNSTTALLSQGGEADTPAIAANGTIYVGVNSALFAVGQNPPSINSVVYALNPDLTIQWKSAPLPGGFVSSPAISPLDGSIYVGTADGLTALDTTGAVEWTASDVSTLSPPAVAADGTIYVAQPNSLSAYSTSGTKNWSFSPDSGFSIPAGNSPAIGSDGTIYIGSDDSGTSSFYAVNPDGSQKWSVAEPSEVRSSPAIGASGAIYLGTQIGQLIAIK